MLTVRSLALLATSILAVPAALAALQQRNRNGNNRNGNTNNGGGGIQLIADNFATIMQGGDGAVDGINVATVLNPVVGNEDLQFAAATKRDLADALLP